MAEFSRVIRRPKFGLTPERIAENEAYIRKSTKRVEPAMKLDVVLVTPATALFLNARWSQGLRRSSGTTTTCSV
jgi:hypothetical protein